MPRMLYCSGDLLGLVAEVSARRIGLVCGAMAKRQGGELRLAPPEVEELKFVRRLHHRFRGGDYRMNENELARLKDVCLWLLRRHAECHSQPEPQEPLWNDTAMWSLTKLPPKAYEDLIEAIHTGHIDQAAGVDKE